MTRPQRSIFRADAVRRYIEGREEAILPRFVSPRTFLFLWFLLGLFLASGFAAWLTEVPVYASGPAVLVDGRTGGLSHPDELVLVAFLPPQTLSHLRVGQALWLQRDSARERFRQPILAVNPEISSPARAQKQFGLPPGAAQAITQPAAVAVARWQPLHEGLPSSAYIGSVYRADLEVGSRRVISLLPLVGPFFGE
jgi:hypothetical protein